MYLLDMLLIILLVYTIVKAFLSSTRSVVKRTIALLSTFLIVVSLFYFEQVNVIFEPLFEQVNNLLEKIVKIDKTVIKSSVLASPYFIPLATFLIMFILTYFIIYALCSLVIKKKVVEKRITAPHSRTNYFINIIGSLVVFAVFAFLICESLLIVGAISGVDKDFFGFIYRNLDYNPHLSELLERVFTRLPGGGVL